MKKLSASILFLMAAFGANASQVNICTDAEGKKTYQQMPCKDAVKAESKVYESTMIGTNMESLDFDGEDKKMQIRQLNRAISVSRGRISKHQTAMNREMAILRQKKQYANNNLAGAQWESSISNEMSAVGAKWDSMIRVEQSNLDRLREQVSSLESELKTKD